MRAKSQRRSEVNKILFNMAWIPSWSESCCTWSLSGFNTPPSLYSTWMVRVRVGGGGQSFKIITSKNESILDPAADPCNCMRWLFHTVTLCAGTMWQCQDADGTHAWINVSVNVLLLARLYTEGGGADRGVVKLYLTAPSQAWLGVIKMHRRTSQTDGRAGDLSLTVVISHDLRDGCL